MTSPCRYEPFGSPRATIEGIDLATNIPSEVLLPCHNEMAYNPRPNALFFMACQAPAETGGESLLARNCDHSKHVSSELQQFVRAHGGIRYTRAYSDGSRKHKPERQVFMSWQVSSIPRQREFPKLHASLDLPSGGQLVLAAAHDR